MVQFNETKQAQRLEALHRQEEERLVEILSAKYELPYIQIIPAMVHIEALQLLSEDDARNNVMAVFSKEEKRSGHATLNVAIFSPNMQSTRVKVKELEDKGYVVRLHMASRASLEVVWERYADLSQAQKTVAGVIDITGEDIAASMAKLRTIQDVSAELKRVHEDQTPYRATLILKTVLSGAFAIKASDIHAEPGDTSVRLRYRLDGVLQDLFDIDHALYKQLATRIKLLSGLKLNVQRDTQDGRFSIVFQDTEIEIRTSILPGNYGESVVMRILDPASISVPLEALGINEHLLKILLEKVGKPTGMILTTGPTGAGKTTTLYAFLRKILDPETKIITIEDPVEYHIKGIVQTQVDRKTNYDFLSGLRAALRQDPDIIMVGEIRDSETAKIAVNASLTGHLVLSTLHTNNAAGTIPRLLDLGINPKVISASLTVSMAQRLIRKLCEDCKEKSVPTADEKHILDMILEKILAKQPQHKLSTDVVWRPHEGGCVACNMTGYRGRVGIYEAILMDSQVEEMVTKNPSEKEIFQSAEHQGIFTMREDGIYKALSGLTSLEELTRVVDLERDI
jgi:type IV pilus assembly protein PilB